MSEYALFGEDLTAPGFIELEYDLSRLEKLAASAKDVPDDYADDYEFGFYVDDCSNARNHLLKSLWGLTVCTNGDGNSAAQKQSADSARKLAVALDDLAHYYDALTFGQKITDKTEGAFSKCCEVVTDLGYGCELASMLESRFVKPDEPLYDGEQFIDLWSVCVHLGDYELHEKCDVGLAMKFYDVASLDWQGFRSHKGFHAAGRTNALELEQWDAELAILRRIYAYRSAIADKAPDEMRAILGEYEAFRRCSHAGQGEQLSIAGNLIAELKRCYESNGGRDDKLQSTPYARLLAMCAMVLRHRSVVPALSALAGLPKLDQEKGLALIVSYCRGNEYPGEDSVVRYVRNTSRNDTMNDAFLLEVPKVRNAASEIKRQLVATDVDEVSYYTTFDTFKYVLPSSATSKQAIGRLSIMNVAYMNDPSEGKMLVSYLGGEMSGARAGQRVSATYPYVFMKCFTPQVDDIPMWSMYGDDGKGVCVILDWQKTAHASRTSAKDDIDLALYRVCYLNTASSTPVLKKDNEHLSKEQRDALDKSLRELRSAYRKTRTDEERELVLSYLSEINHLFKSSDYSHEKELRLVHYGKGGLRKTAGNPPMLFVQSPFFVHIKELVLGPKFMQVSKHMPYLQNEIEEMCRLTGSACPKITLSAVRYV